MQKRGLITKLNINLKNLVKMVNPIYFPFFKHRGRFAVLYGGSGSGKSWAVAQKIIYRILTEDKHNILCVRNTGNSISKSQFPLLVGTIRDWKLSDHFTINKAAGKEKITFKPNNNQIIFSGLDDVEKLKSIYNISSVWIEEASEILPEDFRELNRRLRGYYGTNQTGKAKYMQIMLSFNPVSELNWLKSRFFDDTHDTLIINSTADAKATQDVRYNTLIIHSTYKDNKYIDDVYAREMEELKKYDEDEYNIYALGMWGVPGGTYFDKKAISNRIKEVMQQKPLKIGYFEYEYKNEKIVDSSIKWIDDRQGYIKLYEEAEEGCHYVGAGDTAGEGSDYNIGYFTNNITKQDVAVLRLNYDEDLYARQMYCLGRYYNNALVGIEINFSTHPNKELERLGYYNLYTREESPDKLTHRIMARYGFQTNKLTRPLALSMLRTEVREHISRIKDLDLLREMTTFIKNEKGRPEAAAGQHDDLIMARAINCYIASQQKDIRDIKSKELKGYYTRSELEDKGYSKRQIDEMLQDMKPWRC